jgi:IMP and pyridine-specific 5'-nucleotidase
LFFSFIVGDFLGCSLNVSFPQTKRKHIQPSFNEVRHILNLAQILAFRRKEDPVKDEESTASGLAVEPTRPSMDPANPPSKNVQLNGPRMITFDGDQTLYSDGANFESNPKLAFYIYQLLRHGVAVAVVTAAGYEYEVEKYELRLSGLLRYFAQSGLSREECERFYLFGGECNYLLQLGHDYRLHPVRETGPGGWSTSTKYLVDSPGNWSEAEVKYLLDGSQETLQQAMEELKLKGRILRKRRSVGLVPLPDAEMTRESLDEAVLRVHEKLHHMNGGCGPGLPFCAFNGGTDAWVDCGSKRVGVQILQCYLGIEPAETLHIGDQFLNTGNDYAARAASPCVWITNPTETSYCLKTILRLAGVSVAVPVVDSKNKESSSAVAENDEDEVAVSAHRNDTAERKAVSHIDFEEIERRRASAKIMDVYTGEMVSGSAALP